MAVSFKEFHQFLTMTEGENSPEKLDEIWNKIFAKKAKEAEEDADEQVDKDKKTVMKAKSAADLRKEKEAERKKELNKKRDEEWAKAKDRIENRGGSAYPNPKSASGGRHADTEWRRTLGARLGEGRNEDHADWQKGYDYAKYMRSKNKQVSQEEISKMDPAFAQGFKKGWKD